MAEFLHDLNIHGAGQIQFKNTAGSNAGKIDQNGDDLVLSNAVGDIIIGNGSDDVYIGDGTNAVDIRFEQNMAIYADSSSTRTLTLGGANTSLVLESPTISGSLALGATTINNKLTFTTANGYILFDYEPSGDTGEYTTEVPLLKVDLNGSESTILSRVSEYRAVVLGIDDTVWLRAGDTGTVIKANVGLTTEQVLMSAEGGFIAYGFPGNDTSWSNRNEFQFRTDSTTASENGLYIGDGSRTQFIDLSRNLKNIGTISSGAITSTGKLTINTGSDDILTLNQTSTDNKWNYINFNNQGTREWFIGQDNSGNFDLYNDNINAYAITVNLSDNSILLNDTVTVAQALNVTSGDVTLSAGNIIVGSQYGIRFNDANTRIYTNTDTPEDLLIEADQDILLTPDGQVNVHSNLVLSSNSYVVSARKFTARDGNGVMLTADDAASGLSIADNGNATFTGNLEVQGADVTITANIIHAGDSNTYFGFQNNDEFRIVAGGSEKLHINTSRIRVNDDILPAADSAYDIGTSSTRFATIYADTLFGDGSNITNVTATDSTKLPLAGGTMTGAITMVDSNVISGSGNVKIYARSTDTGASFMQFQNTSTGSSDSDGLTVGVNSEHAYVWQREAGNLYLGTNDTTAVTIDSSQNVTFAGNITAGNITATGSGNTILRAVSTGGYSQLITQASDSDSAYIFFKDTSGERARLYSSTSNDLIFKTGGGSATALTLNNSGNATFAGTVTVPDLTVTGNLSITGDINSYNVTDLDVEDKTITVGVGQTAANSGSSGLIIDRSDSTNPSLLWNQTDGRFEFNSGVNVSGQLHTTNSVYAKGALYVKDTDGTNNHVQVRSNGTEGFLTVSNGSNWGFIVRGPGNDPRIGAYHGGQLKIEGFHSSDGATGSNAVNLAQFKFADAEFNVNGDITLTGTVDGVDIQTLNTTANAALPKAGGTMTGPLIISDSLSNPNPLLTLYNNTNGGGSTILFGDQSPQSQTGKITFYHADGSSQGGNASFNMTSTEADLVLVLGDGTNTGRIAVGSKADTAEVDYGFLGDVNTGMVRTSADNVSLVAGGVRGVGVGATAVSLKYAGSTKLATTNTGVDITGNTVGTGTAQFSGGSGAGVKVLSIGSSTQTNYTLQDWVNDTHGSTEAYIISYGSGNAQAGNFAMKNLESGGEIFFELANSVEPLRMTSTGATFAGHVRVKDGSNLYLGNQTDLVLSHNGTNSFISNYVGDLIVENAADSKDLIFKCDNGSGGVTSYFELDGSTVVTKFRKHLYLLDDVALKIGNSYDLDIKHDSADSYISNGTGNLYIQSDADDKDIIFRCDDGNGAMETYFFLDGNAGGTNPITIFPDSSYLKFGSSQDLSIVHSGSGSEISHNGTGDLVIQNTTDDSDIIFKSDNGSGGVADYLIIDGSQVSIRMKRKTKWDDNIKATFGDGEDLQIYHDGTDSFYDHYNTGVTYFRQLTTDGDISFWSDNGSGGTTEYFRIDGANEVNKFHKHAQFLDSVEAKFGNGGDLRIYHGQNHSYIDGSSGTGSLYIRPGSGNTVQIEDKDGNDMITASPTEVRLLYNNSEKLATTSTGIIINNSNSITTDSGRLQVNGAFKATGDIVDVDIPYVIHTGWGDDTSTTANKIIPLGNSVTEQNVSAADGQHFFVAPYAGSVKKIIMKNVAGTLSSGFTTELKLYINGSQSALSGELTASSNAITWEPSSSNTFSAADTISLVYQKSASSKYWREVALTMVLIMDSQDI